MKKLLLALFVLLLSSPVMASEPFALVELYTSQGCSSCPPADRILKELAEAAEKQDAPIYTIGFHVDYWDYLGWKDPFSSSENSQRQRRYAQVWRKPNVYTPQMIVNGKHEFGGYRGDLAQKHIDAALKETPQYTLSVVDAKINEASIEFAVDLSDGIGGHVLHAALVENIHDHQVMRGENGGRTLNHANTVRAFRTYDKRHMNDRLRVELPSDINREEATLIVYLQNPDNLTIVAADKHSLN